MSTKKSDLELLRTQLANERSSFEAHWRDLSDWILPRRSRFFVQDANRGDRRNQKIMDSTATLAARTLRSGMMSGVTSPARPWFKLTTPDPDLSEYGSVKYWLEVVSDRMRTIFLRSNVYNSFPIIYGDLGVLGTGAMLIEEDYIDTIRSYVFPIGSYFIANDDRLRVNVFLRDFRMTVRQLLSAFGEKGPDGKLVHFDNFSSTVKGLYDRGELEQWVDVCHVIEPNPDFDPRRMESQFKKYRSVYYERGYGTNLGTTGWVATLDDGIFLRISGFDYFPVLAPRWEVAGEDVYGVSCPGMEALGDIKQLQLHEKRASQAIEKMVNPPMTGPTQLRNAKPTILPGDITYIDVREGQQGFRPAHEVNFRIGELEQKSQQIRARISRAFYEDLFLMLANSDRRQITAREIEERHEEKLLSLGPVLEQLNQDLLDPLIEVTFAMMIKQGLVPPPPQELEGMNLKVEYISIMAQAQKVLGLGGIERFSGFVNQVASVDPKALDKIDTDQLINIYGDLTSVPVAIIRPDEEVQALRAMRAKAQQVQQASEVAAQQASAAKQLSETDMTKDSALSRLIQQARAGQIAAQ